MGWGGRSTFFFWPISWKLLHNFFYSFQFPKIYGSAHLLEYSQKKNRNILFFKIFRQNHHLLFFRKIFQEFLNFSKTTRYIFLIVFGPLRRVIKTSLEKKIKKKSNFNFVKKFRKFFFSMKFLKIFLISPISLKIGSFIVQYK